MRVDRLGILSFFKQVRDEYKRIFWPSRNEVLVSVIIVLIMIFISSVFFLMVDQLVGWFMHSLLGVGE
ncbi:preprotein translocase subunit SecE [Candidatus Liberibacter brunswickensis]